MTEKITRREFMIRSVAATAATGVTLPAAAQDIVTDAKATQLKWSKAPCRFCGVGCGVSVAVKGGQVVATHGDPQSEVNRGELRQGLLPLEDHVRRGPAHAAACSECETAATTSRASSRR